MGQKIDIYMMDTDLEFQNTNHCFQFGGKFTGHNLMYIIYLIICLALFPKWG